MGMICPYNRKSEVQVLQWKQDDEGGETKCEQKAVTTFQMMTCPKEGCGVWRDGRCCYAAIDLENG